MTQGESTDEFNTGRAELYEVLAHPTRILILQTLSNRPLGFSELKRATNLESSGNLSFHLNKMSPLVKTNSEGNYALTDEGREALRMIEATRTTHAEPRPSRFTFHLVHQNAVLAGLVLTLVVLIVVGALFGYVYVTNTNTISSLNKQNSGLLTYSRAANATIKSDISQISELQGNVSSLQSQVSSLQCGITIAANKNLSSNVGPCAGDGLVIGASGITLDCAGHSISGTGSSLTRVGVSLAGMSKVTVENCIVTGFQYGFLLNDSSSDTLSGNTARNDGFGFVLSGSSRNTLTGNVANNDEDSFDLEYSSNSNTLTKNTAYHDVFGFAMLESNNNTLTTNTSNNEGRYGIALDLSSYDTLTNNTANNNAVNGFFLKFSSLNNTFGENTANDNGLDGFYLYNSSNGNTFSRNTANDNAQYGYYDGSSGSGTAGTANFYTNDLCNGNGVGGSSPSTLGTPQS